MRMSEYSTSDWLVSSLNGMIDRLEDKSNISDGSHTFGDLYYHRMILFATICNQNHKNAWKSWFHDDGTMFDDYFIAGVTTPNGQFTYHYHKDHWTVFDVEEVKQAPKWDGHTAEDVSRLLSLKEEME